MVSWRWRRLLRRGCSRSSIWRKCRSLVVAVSWLMLVTRRRRMCCSTKAAAPGLTPRRLTAVTGSAGICPASKPPSPTVTSPAPISTHSLITPRTVTDEERSDVAAIADELIDDATAQPAGLFDRTVKNRIDAIRNQHRPDNDVDELERQRNMSKVKRWTDRDTGMRNTMISLDPIRDETLWNVINSHLATLRQDPANKQRPFEATAGRSGHGRRLSMRQVAGVCRRSWSTPRSTRCATAVTPTRCVKPLTAPPFRSPRCNACAAKRSSKPSS